MTEAVWKRHTHDVAWPTFALFAFVIVNHAAVWVAVLNDVMPLWVGAVLQTVFAYLAFTVAHEASHGNLHGRRKFLKWFEELAGWGAGALLFAPYPAFRVLHLQHHSHVNKGEEDPDLWVAGSNLFMVTARCATILPHYYFTILFGASSRTNAGRKVRPISLAVLALFILGFVALSVSGFALEAFALWFGPAWIASAVLAFALDWFPHHPHDSTERYHNSRIVPGMVLEALTLGHSYHLIHHLYPRVPFYRYRACFHDILPELEAHGARIDR